jgi:hypothetical protein
MMPLETSPRHLVGALATVLSIATLSLTADARADAIGGPPDDCPVGTTGRSDHGGEYCHPTVCAGAGDCPDDRLCEPQGLCITATTRSISHRGGSGQVPFEEVSGPCDDDSDCRAPARCVVANRCTTPSLVGALDPRNLAEVYENDGCGCHTPGRPSTSSTGLLVGLAFLLAGAAWLRRGGLVRRGLRLRRSRSRLLNADRRRPSWRSL